MRSISSSLFSGLKRGLGRFRYQWKSVWKQCSARAEPGHLLVRGQVHEKGDILELSSLPASRCDPRVFQYIAFFSLFSLLTTVYLPLIWAIFGESTQEGQSLFSLPVLGLNNRISVVFFTCLSLLSQPWPILKWRLHIVGSVPEMSLGFAPIFSVPEK